MIETRDITIGIKGILMLNNHRTAHAIMRIRKIIILIVIEIKTMRFLKFLDIKTSKKKDNNYNKIDIKIGRTILRKTDIKTLKKKDNRTDIKTNYRANNKADIKTNKSINNIPDIKIDNRINNIPDYKKKNNKIDNILHRVS